MLDTLIYATHAMHETNASYMNSCTFNTRYYSGLITKPKKGVCITFYYIINIRGKPGKIK